MASVTPNAKKEICPVVESIYTIGNKWSLVITYNLMKSPKRFNELKACIPGISSKVLTENLTELQRNGIIIKKTIPDEPEKAEYALTEKGEDLRQLMLEMRAWGERWLFPPGEGTQIEVSDPRMAVPAERKNHSAGTVITGA